jgi:methenyltetrahydrofolate cyclohydrolase
MEGIAQRRLGELLEEVAAATPAPGGGTSAAVTCALAAGLLEMTGRFGVRRAPAGSTRTATLAEVAAQAAVLRAESLELAERELSAYGPVLEALKLPATEPGRQSRLTAALSTAADPPLALANVAAELADLALGALRAGVGHLRGDALTGLLLAEAACQTATRLVDINLGGRPEDPRRNQARSARERASAARIEALRAEPG